MQQKEETNLLFVAVIGFAFFMFMRSSSAARYVMGPNGSPIVPPYMSGMSAAQQWQYQLQMQQQQNMQQASLYQQAGSVISNLIDRIWPGQKPAPAPARPMLQDDAMVGQVAPGMDGVYNSGTYYPMP